MVVPLCGVQRGSDFFQGASGLKLALGREFLEHGGLALGSVERGLDALAVLRVGLEGHPQGVQEFGLAGGILSDGCTDVPLQRREPAVGHELVTINAGAAGHVGLFGGDGEDGKVAPETLAGQLRHVVGDDQEFLWTAHITLLEDEDDVAHPVTVDFFEELPRGGTPGVHGGKNEDD